MIRPRKKSRKYNNYLFRLFSDLENDNKLKWWTSFKIVCILFFRKLGSGEKKLAKILFLFLIIAMFFCAYWIKSEDPYYIIFLSFGSSLMAALFIDIFRRTREEIEEETKSFNLRRIFNCSFDEKNTVLILSKFPLSINKEGILGYEKDLYRMVHHEKYGIDKITKDVVNMEHDEELKYYSTISYQDLIASTNIKSIFESMGMPRPFIHTDKEILKRLLRRPAYKYIYPKHTLPYKTFICIGLFSNEITMWMNEKFSPESNGRLFDFFFEDNLPPSQGQIKIACHKGERIEYDEEKWHLSFKEETRKSIVKTYGLVARLFHQDYCFIIIGGLTANATKLMGSYVRENWNKFLLFEDSVTKTRINFRNPFALVFTIQDGKVLEEQSNMEIRIAKEI